MKRVSSIVIAVALLFCCFSTSASSATVKDWTVAVFLNADNNLDPFGVEDQEEMARVGSNEFLNIVSLIDRERGPAQINYIEKGNIKKVKDLGEIDMGDYRQLVNFMKFVKENYPAKKYCLVIWNHGSGWKNKNINSVYRGISYDDSSNNHITNEQLGIAMAEITKILGQKVDVFDMDACLMQMVEVAHVVKDHVLYQIASEELEPGKGAPYDDILKGVKKGMTPRQFCINWVNAFAKSYDGGSQGHDESTQSAIDMSRFDALVDALNGMAKTLMSGKYARNVKAALNQVQKFDFPENIDLIHFTELLKAQLPGDEAVKTACDKVLAAAKAAVIIYKNTGFSTKNAKGIAIYLPGYFQVEPKYLTLSFAKQTLWDEMIAVLYKRDMADRIVDGIAAGDLDPMRNLVEAARDDKGNAALYRFLIRELNYELFTEKALPENLTVEFTKLFNELKKTITR